MTELVGAAEKMMFGFRERKPSPKLELEQVERADKIRHLKQAVSGRLHILGEFHRTADTRLKHLKKLSGGTQILPLTRSPFPASR